MKHWNGTAKKVSMPSKSLLDELDEAIRLVVDNPTAWQKHDLDTRRHVMAKFPYALIYRIDGDQIEFVAFAHHSRKTSYWHDR